ncbi:MAG: c-type cytochrome [Chromatiales bacterium]|nr:c-type cytochrome [Chromatiales bacterium]
MHRILVATAVLLFAASPAVHAAELDPLLSYTGPQLYQRFCASCHGPQAYGDGPVAPTLKVMVPDLTRIARRQQGGEFPEERIREIVDGRAVLPAHGLRDMPVWGYELEAQAPADQPGRAAAQGLIDRLVAYLRSIQQ